MRVISLLAPLALAQVALAYVPVLDRRACNADNCARAVTATASTSKHSIDCNSFLATTVTPSTSTVTATATTIVAKRHVAPEALVKRANTVPAYASACSGSVRYSSACSCFGATGTTVTAATPTTTITVTVTSSSSTTSSTTSTSSSTSSSDPSSPSSSSSTSSSSSSSSSSSDPSSPSSSSSSSSSSSPSSTSSSSPSSTSSSSPSSSTTSSSPSSSTSSSSPSSSSSSSSSSTSQAPSQFTAVPLDGGCITQSDAANVVGNFSYLLASPQADDFNSTAYALFSDDFIDTSDSINSLAGIPLGSDTFTNKAAFVSGSGSQPPLYVSTLEFIAACNAIAWRWQSISGVGDDAEKVKGIDVFHIAETGQISHTFAEFNSLAFSYDLGSPECSSSSRIMARSRRYIEPRMI